MRECIYIYMVYVGEYTAQEAEVGIEAAIGKALSHDI